MSVAQLQAEIQSLTAQLTQLEAQLAAQGGSTNTWCYNFNTNLSIGMSGAAVTALQTALQKDGESVTMTGTFDDQTASAVTAFQEKYQSQILAPYGLSYGTGYAGKSTRAELNSLFGCGTIPVQPIGSTPVNSSPAMSVYQNSQYGVQFSYLSNYTVKYGNAAFGTSNNPLGDDGIGMENPNLTSLVTIEMPSNSYPDTGFDGAYLNVSVGTQMTSSQCSAMNTAGSSPSNGIKTIGGVPFNWSVMGSAAAGTDYTNGSFSGYTNGTCYVLLAGGVEGNGAIGNVGSDGVTITAVNQNSILAALNSVLATMTFSAPSKSTQTNSYSLSPSYGSAGTVTTLSPVFSVCASNTPVGECTEDRFDTYEWIESGSNVAIQTAPGGTNGAETFQIPASLTPGTYELTVQNNLGKTGTTYSLAAFTVTATTNITSTPISTVLSVAQNPSFQAGSFIAGSQFTEIGSYTITAPSSEGVTLNSVTLQAGQNASSLQNMFVSVMTAANSGGQGGTVVATPTNNGTYVFPANGVISIPAGQSYAINVLANIANAVSLGAQNMTALTACSATGQVSYTIYTCPSVTGQTMTFTTVTTNSSAPRVSLTPSTFNFSIVQGQMNMYPSGTSTFVISPNQSVNWTVWSPTWGSVASPILTATNGSSVDIELDQNVATLAPGIYAGTYTFSPPSGSGVTFTPQTVTVNLTVTPASATYPVFSLSPSFGPVGTITTLSSTNSQCGVLNQCTYVWLQNGSTVATNAQWTSPNQIQVPASCALGICDLGIWNPAKTLESEVPFNVTSN